MTSEPAPTGSNWQVVGVDAVVLVRTLDAVYTLSAGSLGPGRRARPQQRFNELFKGI